MSTTVRNGVHGRPSADRFRSRGFLDHGMTTTPFDMVVRNKVSRYHLVMDALNNAARTVREADLDFATQFVNYR